MGISGIDDECGNTVFKIINATVVVIIVTILATKIMINLGDMINKRDKGSSPYKQSVCVYTYTYVCTHIHMALGVHVKPKKQIQPEAYM